MKLSEKEYIVLGKTLADNSTMLLYNIKYKSASESLNMVDAALDTLTRAREALMTGLGRTEGSVGIRIPEFGDEISEVTIGKLCVEVGQSVSKDEVIAIVETDKITIEIFSPVDGVIDSWTAGEGDDVSVDFDIGYITPKAKESDRDKPESKFKSLEKKG